MRTGLDNSWSILQGYPAIDLDPGCEALFIDHPAQGGDLLQGILNKFLSAKTRVYTHDQDQINIVQYFFKGFYRSMRIQRYTGLHTQRFYLFYIPMQMRTGF